MLADHHDRIGLKDSLVAENSRIGAWLNDPQVAGNPLILIGLNDSLVAGNSRILGLNDSGSREFSYRGPAK